MRELLLVAQILFYIGAGINHLINPNLYVRFLQYWMHGPVITLSGIVEILLGILLAPAVTRRYAAWLIVVMLTVFLFAVHVPMAMESAEKHDPKLWLMIARLPVQLLLMAWAWMFTRKPPAGA